MSSAVFPRFVPWGSRVGDLQVGRGDPTYVPIHISQHTDYKHRAATAFRFFCATEHLIYGIDLPAIYAYEPDA